jgi:site-specific DNA recombinase
MSKTVRCVGYVRVSTDEQTEGTSLEAQESAIKRYCENKTLSGDDAWQYVRTYSDDGYSAYNGKSKRRPQFNAMMNDTDDWDCCVGLYLNRFWRNTLSALKWLNDLSDLGKHVVAMDMQLDTTTPVGEMVFTMMSAIAKLESAQTSHRVKTVFDHRFNDDDDDKCFTRAPLGYDNNTKEHTLVINDDEATTIQTAFKMAVSMPQRAIAIALNERGFRGKQGKAFSQPSIAHILHNPTYAGYLYRNGTLKRNGHLAIVDDDLFNRVQKAMWLRGSKARKHAPLQVGADSIRVERMNTSGNSLALYVPQ